MHDIGPRHQIINGRISIPSKAIRQNGQYVIAFSKVVPGIAGNGTAQIENLRRATCRYSGNASAYFFTMMSVTTDAEA